MSLSSARMPYRPMGPRGFVPAYVRYSRNIAMRPGPMRNVLPGGGGAVLVRLFDGRKVIVPSAAGATLYGKRPMIIPRDSAVAGVIPVSPRVAVSLARMLAPAIGTGFVVRGIVPDRVVNGLMQASRRSPLIRPFRPRRLGMKSSARALAGFGEH